MSSVVLLSRPHPAVPVQEWWADTRLSRWVRQLSIAGLLLLAVALGAASTLRPALAVAGCFAASLIVAVALRPELGGYLVVAITPLVAGIDRGHLVPLFRPSEALVLLVATGLALRAALHRRTGTLVGFRLNRIEVGLLLMAACNSIVPLVWMVARHHAITHDDVLYALVLWKFVGVYVVVRISITTDRHVLRMLWLSVGAASVVAIVAVLQSMGLFGVPHLLSTYYAPFGYTNLLQNSRGSSTLGIPAATADLMIYNLAIVAGLWLRTHRLRPLLGAAVVLFVVGALSAGEFSSAIGLVLGVVCVAVVIRQPRLLAWFAGAAVIAFFTLRPVIERRLTGFQSVSGVPVSWTGRLENLQSYFWPRLFSDGNYLFGVQPAARVPVATQGTGYVWIESGYTWLLWGGGIPLLLSFCYFGYTATRAGWTAARGRMDARSVAGVAVFVAVIVMTVSMIFDPHLTYRGAAEEMFALLAVLSVSKVSPHRAPSTARVTTPIAPSEV